MKNFFIISFLLLAISSIVFGGDRGTKYDDYFPLKIGYKWLYKTTAEGNMPLFVEIDVTCEVTGKEKVGNIECHVFELRFGIEEDRAFALKIYISSSRDGIKIHKIDSKIYDNPILLLKYPLMKGNEWETEIENKKVKFKIEGEEEISVPAGKFKCHKIKIVGIEREGDMSVWLAKGNGVIKCAQTIGINGSDATVTLSLKSLDKNIKK